MPLLPSWRELLAPAAAALPRPGVPALSLLILLALALGLVALLGCAAWGALPPRPAPRAPASSRRAATGRLAGWLCVGGLALDLLFLLGGAEAAALPLPVGLPGFGATLALDPLSGLFLLPLLLAAACAWLAAPAEATPVPLAAACLVVLAGDGFSLVLGASAVTLTGWATLLAAPAQPSGRRWAAALWLGSLAGGTLCLLAALALLLPSGGLLPGLGFPVLRALPPAGPRADAVLLLAVAAAAAFGGLPPLSGWLAAACRLLPSPRAALLAGIAGALGPYLAARLLLDLGGPATPAWWGVPLLLLGAAAVPLGALRALQAGEARGVGVGAAIAGSGTALLGLGVALLARGADLPVLAALGLAGGLLAVLAGAPVQALLLLAGGALEAGAGTRRLERMGGLLARMPATAACLLVAAAGLATLPPSAGFAVAWLVLQALLAATRLGGLPLQLLLVAVLAAFGLGLGLLGLAGLRLVAAALLGRPRSPRGAAADEAPPGLRAVLIGLAGLSTLLGLLPGAALALADPALRLLAGAGLEGRSGLWSLAPQRDAPGYAPLAVAMLLAALGVVVLVTLRVRAPGMLRVRAPARAAVPAGDDGRSEACADPSGAAAGDAPGALGAIGRGLQPGAAWAGHRVTAWEDGFAAPPPWLPFGDPATQIAADALADIPVRALGLATGDPGQRSGPRAPARRVAVGLRRPAALGLPAVLGLPAALRLRRRLTRVAVRAATPSAGTALRRMLVGVVALLLGVALWQR